MQKNRRAIATNFSYFVASKLRNSQNRSFSRVISKIAVGSIAIGLAVMIISSLIYEGYKDAIQRKLFSVAAHFDVTKFDESNTFEKTPLSTETYLYKNISTLPEVSHIQSYVIKPGLLKTEDEVYGITLKGVGTDYSMEYFQENMLEGEFVDVSQSESDTLESGLGIVISLNVAKDLRLKVGDKVKIYFIQKPLRYRPAYIKGIFQTGLADFDELVAFAKKSDLQKLNRWPDSLVSGYELFINDISLIDDVESSLNNLRQHDMYILSATSRFQNFFDWFIMLNKNVKVLITIVLVVAGFNIISILIIMIMERTHMIGSLKALGASNWQIRKIFMYSGLNLVFKGLLFGNLLGLGLGALQYYFKLIPLDPQNYYVSYVPLQFNWLTVLFMNLITLGLSFFLLLIPTRIIAQIRPIKSIKFD